jgi:hypothetical protein
MLSKRLDRLEAIVKPDGQPANIPLPELISKVETALELPAGSLPRTAEEAWAAGYDNMAGALAFVLGCSIAELKECLTHENYHGSN